MKIQNINDLVSESHYSVVVHINTVSMYYTCIYMYNNSIIIYIIYSVQITYTLMVMHVIYKSCCLEHYDYFIQMYIITLSFQIGHENITISYSHYQLQISTKAWHNYPYKK